MSDAIAGFFDFSVYGLGSMVYTKDSEKANRIASLIDAGQVGINCYPLEHLGTQCPWYVTDVFIMIHAIILYLRCFFAHTVLRTIAFSRHFHEFSTTGLGTRPVVLAITLDLMVAYNFLSPRQSLPDSFRQKFLLSEAN